MIFSPDDDNQCFRVPILSDELSEGTEELTAAITAISEGVVVSEPGDTTISIIDSNGKTSEYVQIINTTSIPSCNYQTLKLCCFTTNT